MKRFRITSKRLFKITVVLLGIPAFLLLIVASLLFFLLFGGGWAYGANGRGCHFVLNPLGILMLASAAVGLFAFLWNVGRRWAQPTMLASRQ